MQCAQRSLALNDGLKSVFLNTSGKNRPEVSPELAAFLDYLSDPEGYDKTADLLIDTINSQVEQIKVDRNWEDKLMLLYETLKEERAEGRAEGRVEGRAEGLAEGRAEGLAEGLEKGRHEIVKELILKKMQLGYDAETIAEQLGLPSEEVRDLYCELSSEA